MSVYFITCRDAGAVKIGSSGHPHGRMRDLRTMCPLPIALEAVLPGRHEEEFALHRRFAADRMHGEWFRLTDEIEAMIAANPPKPELPPSIPDPTLVVKRRRRLTALERVDLAREQERAARQRTEQRMLAKRVQAGEIHFPFRAEEPVARLSRELAAAVEEL